MDAEDLVIRLALGAIVGLGFVPSTVGAALSAVGLSRSTAVLGGSLVGIVVCCWIVYAGRRVR